MNASDPTLDGKSAAGVHWHAGWFRCSVFVQHVG